MEAIYQQNGGIIDALSETRFDDQRISKDIPVKVAHKIGDAYDFRHDVAIVYTDSPFILAIFLRITLITRLSQQLPKIFMRSYSNERKISSVLSKEGLFESHQKVLLALSGGVDSMTLLDCLYHYRHQLGIDLVLAHVNHHQRIEADQEERGIQAIAEVKHLPLKVAHFSGPFSEKPS